MADNQSGGDPKKKGQGINDMILSSMKSRSGRDTTKWINNLTSEGMQEIEEAAKAPAPQTGLPAQFAHPSIAQTQVKWVDRLFDILQQYEVEFNRAIQIPDLRVVTERAVITSDLIQRLQSNDQYHYSGRLYTRFWTLAVRGNLSHLEAFIIPSDHYIGFENNINSYTRLFEFIPVWDGELRWSFDRGSIGYGQLPSMAKLIFGHLIKVAKGDIDSDELFTYGMSTPAPPPKPMGSSSLPSATSSPESEFLVHHSGVFEDDKPTLSEGQAAAEGRGNKASLPAERASDSPAATQAANSNEARTTPGDKANLPANAGSADLDIAGALDILSKAISKELENLSKAGAKAFEDHDFIEVERLLKRTSKLKAMRDKMLATIKEWKTMLGDA